MNLIEPIRDVGCISPIIVHETVFNSPDVEAEIDGSVVGNIGVSNVADANYVNVKSVHIDPKIAAESVDQSCVTISIPGPAMVKCIAPQGIVSVDEEQVKFKPIVNVSDGIAAAVTRLQTRSAGVSPMLVPSQNIISTEELVKLQKSDKSDDSLKLYWQYAKDKSKDV